MGADGIELDVRLTRDGALVVCHDETLERLAGVPFRIADLTREEVQRFDVGRRVDQRFAGERIPALEEVLDGTAGRLLVNIEIKIDAAEARVEERIAALLRERGLLDRVVISSFLPAPLERSKRVEPELATALLYNRPELLPEIEARSWQILRAPELRVDALHPGFRLATPEHIAWAHRHGFGLTVWTVNDEIEMRRLIALEVEGITTDYPDRLARLLRAQQR